MKKFWLTIAGTVLILGVVVLAGCGANNGTPVKVDLNSQQVGIWVNGEGKIPVVPDVATISLGIEAQEVTVAEAQVKAAEAMDKVMKALKDMGIAEKDIQTRYFNIQKVTRWDDGKQQEVVIGYRVVNTVTAKVRKVADAGPVIDAVVAAGGDFTRIDSIAFSVDDPSPYYEQARVKAVADAAAKAKKLAETAGVKLGNPTYITESSYIPVIYRDVAKAEAMGPSIVTPVSPGEMEITANVQMAYAIAD